MNTLVEILVNCGCGKHFTSIKEGMEHATQTNHCLTVQGLIDPRKVKSGQTVSAG